ncbi:MAG: DUF1289 domain-containing protein [Rhodocyclaceae bacterium]|nr:MAG: DUF1289 domain-containing protein [Rhodocyclaceae bacterium]
MDYECIGVCTPDPFSGLCEGCGRPLVEPQVTDTGTNTAPSPETTTPCN